MAMVMKAPMGTNVNGRPPVRARQVSRRTLLPFLPDRLRGPQKSVEGEVIEVEQAPVAVTCDELQPHGTQQIEQFLTRLGDSASRSKKNLNGTEV
jgi:hypothetical protein